MIYPVGTSGVVVQTIDCVDQQIIDGFRSHSLDRSER